MSHTAPSADAQKLKGAVRSLGVTGLLHPPPQAAAPVLFRGHKPTGGPSPLQVSGNAPGSYPDHSCPHPLDKVSCVV